MDPILVSFIVGSIVGTLVSQMFRLRDMAQVAKYIDENNRLLMSNMDIAEDNQNLLEQLAKQQGIEWSQEGNKP